MEENLEDLKFQISSIIGNTIVRNHDKKENSTGFMKHNRKELVNKVGAKIENWSKCKILNQLGLNSCFQKNAGLFRNGSPMCNILYSYCGRIFKINVQKHFQKPYETFALNRLIVHIQTTISDE